MGGKRELVRDWLFLWANDSEPYRPVVEGRSQSAGSLPTPACLDARPLRARSACVLVLAAN